MAEMSHCFRHNAYMYTYLVCRCEDAILVILCISLPIATIVAGEWLNSLIFRFGANYIRLTFILHKKDLKRAK